MKTTHPAIAALVLPALLTVGAGATAHAAADADRVPTCHGKVATIVGSGVIEGTNGPDVIVSRGTAVIEALGGNDTICMTGRPDPRTGYLSVESGPGDDYVENRVTSHDSSTVLGSGDDTYLGSSQDEWVAAGVGWVTDDGHDTISTFGGADHVESGGVDVPNSDVIRLGDGPDEMTLGGLDNRDATIRGGSGRDFLHMRRRSAVSTGAWVFDNTTQVATLDGVTTLTWDSFQAFNVSSFRGTSETFIGSSRSERISIYARGGISVDLGGGDDTVESRFGAEAAGTLRGGTGWDKLIVAAHRDYVKITGSLQAGSVRFRYLPQAESTPFPESTWQVAGFSALKAEASRVIVIGDDTANQLSGNGCNVTIAGGGGDDRLSGVNRGSPRYYRCHRPDTSVAYGGAGDDRLLGNDHANTLLGGEGWDRANGFQGQDTCRAEFEEACELN